MSQDEVKTKDEVSKFIITVSKIGEVKVDISGPHINKIVFNRLNLALKKYYNLSIKAYRRQVRLEKLNETKNITKGTVTR